MIHQRFVVKGSSIAGVAPTVKGETPDVNYGSMGLKALRIDIVDGKQPRVNVALDVKTVDVDIPNCQVVLNAVNVSVDSAVELYQNLEKALVSLGVLVPADAPEAGGAANEGGSGIVLAKG